MPSRRTVARLAFLPPAALGLAIAACSSQAPERAVESSEAVTTCTSPTEVRSCDFNEQLGRSVCGCMDWATLDTDACGDGWIPVPPALTGCKLGVWMIGQTPLSPEAVWACPGTVKSQLPPSLGVGGAAGLPTCQFSSDAGPPAAMPCEEVNWVDSIDTTCVVSMPAGWGYVWDHIVTACCETKCQSGSGCGGPCGLVSPPPR